MAHLIFIEGVSGVGKSTISLALREALPGARCFLEGDSDSPLDLFHVSYLTRAQHAALLRAHPASAGALNKRSVIEADYALIRYRNAAREPLFPPELQQYLEARELCYRAQNPPPLPEYEKVFLNLWRQFAQREKLGFPHLIFDGALLHHQINDLMRNYDAGGEEIAAHICALARTVAALQPVLIYLSTGDVESRLAQARRNRGQAPPTAAEIAFWERRKEMDLHVLERLPVEIHTVDLSDWPLKAALETILPLVAG